MAMNHQDWTIKNPLENRIRIFYAIHNRAINNLSFMWTGLHKPLGGEVDGGNNCHSPNLKPLHSINPNLLL